MWDCQTSQRDGWTCSRSISSLKYTGSARESFSAWWWWKRQGQHSEPGRSRRIPIYLHLSSDTAHTSPRLVWEVRGERWESTEVWVYTHHNLSRTHTQPDVQFIGQFVGSDWVPPGFDMRKKLMLWPMFGILISQDFNKLSSTLELESPGYGSLVIKTMGGKKLAQAAQNYPPGR
jgi:hypothetical protein